MQTAAAGVGGISQQQYGLYISNENNIPLAQRKANDSVAIRMDTNQLLYRDNPNSAWKLVTGNPNNYRPNIKELINNYRQYQAAQQQQLNQQQSQQPAPGPSKYTQNTAQPQQPQQARTTGADMDRATGVANQQPAAELPPFPPNSKPAAVLPQYPPNMGQQQQPASVLPPHPPNQRQQKRQTGADIDKATNVAKATGLPKYSPSPRGQAQAGYNNIQTKYSNVKKETTISDDALHELGSKIAQHFIDRINQTNDPKKVAEINREASNYITTYAQQQHDKHPSSKAAGIISAYFDCVARATNDRLDEIAPAQPTKGLR